MSEPTPPELLVSLGRLTRGLSALFWGLPLALLVCVQTARTDWLHSFGTLPPMVANGLLVYGLWQMRSFQPRERGWQFALDRAVFLGAVNLGLAPFLFWWAQMPNQPVFGGAVALLSLTAIVFLAHLNVVIRLLGALLPDETLRQETRGFTGLNRALLLLTFLLAGAYFSLMQFSGWVPAAVLYIFHSNLKLQLFILVLLVLVPLAMTMALLWKAKEVILASVFGRRT